MLQQTCARKFRRGQDRGDDRRHDQPAIPRPQPRAASTRTSCAPRTSRAPSTEPSLLSFVTSLSNVVSRLCRFSRPLASPTPLTTTGATLIPFKLCTRPLSPSCLTRLFLIPTLPPLITPVILRRRLPLMSVQGLFFSLSFCFRSTVLPRLLTWGACTWNACHSQPPLPTLPFVCVC